MRIAAEKKRKQDEERRRKHEEDRPSWRGAHRRNDGSSVRGVRSTKTNRTDDRQIANDRDVQQWMNLRLKRTTFGCDRCPLFWFGGLRRVFPSGETVVTARLNNQGWARGSRKDMDRSCT